MSYTLLPNFAWAVPEAFLDALGQCRFAQGDILYSSPLAYSLPWGEAIKQVKFSIQVGLASGTAEQAEEEEKTQSVFAQNWSAYVDFEFTDYRLNRTTKVKTSQGNLYSLIWKGQLEAEPCPVPLTFAEATRSHLNLDNVPLPDFGHSFAFAFDIANQVSRSKEALLRESLTDCDQKIYTVSEASCWKGLDLIPTTRLTIFHFPTGTEGEIHSRLKALLHKPNPKAKKQMFNLRKHGLLSRLTPQGELLFQ